MGNTKRWNKEQRVNIVKLFYENKCNLVKTQRKCATISINLKMGVQIYKDPAPETIQDLKQNIKREIRKINRAVLLKVCNNFVSRPIMLIPNEGPGLNI